MIYKFISEFCSAGFEFEGELIKKGRNYYLINSDIEPYINAIKRPLFSAGIFLGRVKGKEFKPSPSLLSYISKYTSKKAVVDDKAAWLFVCGRDLFKESVISCPSKVGLVLVENLQNETLGVGKVMGKKSRIAIKNIFDIGYYIRGSS